MTVRGELDVMTTSFLEDEVNRRRPLSRPLALDLGGVTFIDSSGVRGLLAARRAAMEDVGTPVRVVAVSPIVRRVLEVTGVADALLELTDREDGGGLTAG